MAVDFGLGQFSSPGVALVKLNAALLRKDWGSDTAPRRPFNGKVERAAFNLMITLLSTADQRPSLDLSEPFLAFRAARAYPNSDGACERNDEDLERYGGELTAWTDRVLTASVVEAYVEDAKRGRRPSKFRTATAELVEGCFATNDTAAFSQLTRVTPLADEARCIYMVEFEPILISASITEETPKGGK